MSAQINNSENKKVSDNQPILCIPGVFANIKEERIRRIFGDLNLGDVARVDIVVPKKPVGAEEKENKFNRVFVHINWNNTPSAVACRKKLLEGKEVKIIYDEPWFWKVSAYKPPAPKPRFEKPRPFQPKKATLELDFEPAEVQYSGVIAKGLENSLPEEVQYSGVIAKGLENSLPEEVRYSEVVAKGLDNTPICPRPSAEYDDYGNEIPAPIDYGNAPAPKKKTKAPITSEKPNGGVVIVNTKK
jgi:hypothetical protein